MGQSRYKWDFKGPTSKTKLFNAQIKGRSLFDAQELMRRCFAHSSLAPNRNVFLCVFILLCASTHPIYFSRKTSWKQRNRVLKWVPIFQAQKSEIGKIAQKKNEKQNINLLKVLMQWESYYLNVALQFNFVIFVHNICNSRHTCNMQVAYYKDKLLWGSNIK